MSVYRDHRGKRWISYSDRMLDGRTGELLHPEGAETDMGDCEFREVERVFGPLREEINTDYLRRLHPDWEVVTALCEEVDELRKSCGALARDLDVNVEFKNNANTRLCRLDAALTELVHHGDLTPAGKRVLQRILGGEE